MTETNDAGTKPVKLTLQARAERTDVIAREIMASEVAEREKKTARLREMRLQQTVDEPAPEKKPRARKTVKK
ncbi:hypothetical protein [Rhizobium halophytocola]|uniref:Phage-related minor tail protein n=1 Tax=Rhizobium halophytocola TaxID=735519 RepID=A0ABS4DZG7_9HYPH|nr:hypothetical protein [Rhizobium halophytocola]MBP1851079.1 phage-related minor tail protein [Rhizobium halophytocola]